MSQRPPICAAIPVSEAEPSPWVGVQTVARLRKIPLSAFHFVNPRLVFGLAACLLIGIVIFNFHEKQPSSTPVTAVAMTGVDVWNDPLEEDLSRLENLMATLSGDPLEIMGR